METGMNPLEARLIKQVWQYVFQWVSDGGHAAEELQQEVRALRRAYRPAWGDAVENCYGTDALRSAYMAAYYVHYILPVKRVLSDFFTARPAFLRRPLRVRYLAGGPCPELVGTLMTLWESHGFLPQEVVVLDAEAGWRPYLEATTGLCRQLYREAPPVRLHTGCDLQKSCGQCGACGDCRRDTFETADLLVMQNYLSHVAEWDVDDFLAAMEARIRCLPRGAAVLVMDLNYDQTRQVLQAMDSFAGLRTWKTNGYDAVPDTCRIGTPTDWCESIFTGAEGLIPRQRTRYYYGVYEVA